MPPPPPPPPPTPPPSTPPQTGSESPGEARPSRNEHVAIYPGSFDPITLGHLDVVQRARRVFDRIVVGIGHNPAKDQLFNATERLDIVTRLLEDLVHGHPDVAPVEVHPFEGLTVDFARSVGASVLLRGVRNLSDLQHEVRQAAINREVAGLETVFMVAGQNYAYTSSTLIKQITAMGQDLEPLRAMVPDIVLEALKRKKAERHPVLQRLLANDDALEEN
jgi:pantetheine-phosphate adenylyltransferase